MGFELPNGKTARNIQEQVAFLTEKVKELFAAVSELGFKVVKVDVLPEEGAARTIYLVPASDPETENSYDEYIWTEDGWEKIGSTDIDLSNYATLDGENSFSEVNTFTTGILTPHIFSNYGDDLEVSSPETLKLYGGSYGIETKGSALPESDNTDSIGSASKRYKDLYLGGKIKIKDQAATPHEWLISHLNDYYFGFGLNGNLLIYFNPAGVLFTRSLEPLSTDVFDLGTTGKRYLTTYTQNISDGTNSATVADIAALITYAKAQGWIS